jgi:hypothetical protein
MTEGGRDSDYLTARLRALRVDPPASDFQSRLHLALVQAGQPPAPGMRQRLSGWLEGRRAWLWPLSGALAGAATFALFALSGLHRPATPGAGRPEVSAAITRGEVLPTFVVPSAKVAVIKLAFSADVDVEDVTFEVTLPDGLSFWSRGQALAERSFRWPGRLTAGENLFPVAVRGERPGRYKVKARAELPPHATVTEAVTGTVVEHEIWLEVRG